MFKLFLEDNQVAARRNLNFDGKTYFFRFPKEFASGLRKGDVVDIKLLDLAGRRFSIELQPKPSKDE